MSEFQQDGPFHTPIDQILNSYKDGLKSMNLPFFERNQFEQIIGHFDAEGHFEAALEACEFAIEQHPFSTEFLFRKGQLLMDLERFSEALEAVDKAEMFDATDIDIQLLRAEIYCAQHLYLKAIETIKEAIEQADHSELDDLYIELSDVYERTEKFDSSFYYLKQSLKINPQNQEALSRIWFCVDFTEKFEESKRLHKKIISQYPYAFMAWFNLGHAERGMGKLEEAVEAFEYAIAINEQYPMAVRAAADGHYELGNYENALYHFKNLLALEKSQKEILFRIGLCHYEMKAYPEARQYFRLSIKKDAGFAEAHFYSGLCLQKEGRHRSALKRFSKAALIKPCAEYLEEVGNEFLELGMFSDAEGFFAKALESKSGGVLLLVKKLYAFSQYQSSEQLAGLVQKNLENTEDAKQRRFLYWMKKVTLGQSVQEDPLVMELFSTQPQILTWVKLLFPLHRGLQQINPTSTDLDI